MRTFLSLLVLSLSLSACQLLSPDVDGDNRVPRVGEAFALAFGQAVTIDDTNLTLSFDDVIGESRCPINVVCIWEGEATIAVGATIQADTTLLELTVPGPRPMRFENNDPLPAGPYTIRLLELNPYPEEDAQPPKSSYRAVLRVDR